MRRAPVRPPCGETDPSRAGACDATQPPVTPTVRKRISGTASRISADTAAPPCDAQLACVWCLWVRCTGEVLQRIRQLGEAELMRRLLAAFITLMFAYAVAHGALDVLARPVVSAARSCHAHDA